MRLSVTRVHTECRAQQLLDLISERTILVQVYVVQGINLRPRDRVQCSDAYVQIACGQTKVGRSHSCAFKFNKLFALFHDVQISDRRNCVPNQTSPTFGKRYQLTAVLPK